MIYNIDDIIKLINENDKVKELKLIYKDNDLTKCCVDLIDAGYIPNIKFEGCRITYILCNFNGINVQIETQHLSKSDLNGIFSVNDEIIYKKMNDSMNNFYKSIFVKNHKSHYSNIDIEILNEYRTIANNGLLVENKNNNKLIEVDIKSLHIFIFRN